MTYSIKYTYEWSTNNLDWRAFCLVFYTHPAPAIDASHAEVEIVDVEIEQLIVLDGEIEINADDIVVELAEEYLNCKRLCDPEPLQMECATKLRESFILMNEDEEDVEDDE